MKLTGSLLWTVVILALMECALDHTAQAAPRQPSGLPAWGEFFDKWSVPGAPAGTLAMGGFGRELMAANDCINKNNVAMACKHWRNLLAVADRLGRPLSEYRTDVEALIEQHNCQ